MNKHAEKTGYQEKNTRCYHFLRIDAVSNAIYASLLIIEGLYEIQ